MFFFLNKYFFNCFQTANLSKGLDLIEAESAIKAIAAVHALTLGMKIKEKVDLNEKYPVCRIFIAKMKCAIT